MKIVKITQSFKPRYEVGKEYGFNDTEAAYLVDNGLATYVVVEEIEVPMLVSSVVKTAKK